MLDVVFEEKTKFFSFFRCRISHSKSAIALSDIQPPMYCIQSIHSHKYLYKTKKCYRWHWNAQIMRLHIQQIFRGAVWANVRAFGSDQHLTKYCKMTMNTVCKIQSWYFEVNLLIIFRFLMKMSRNSECIDFEWYPLKHIKQPTMIC